MPRNLFLVTSIGLLGLYWMGQLWAALRGVSTLPLDRQALWVLLVGAFLLFNALVLRGMADPKPDPRFWRCWWGAAVLWLATLLPFFRALEVERLL